MFRPYCPRMNWLIWHITMVFPFAAAGSADSSMAIVKLPVASPTSIAIDAVIVWQLIEPAVHHGLPVWSGQTLLHSRLSGSDKKAQPPAVSMNAIAGFEPGHCVRTPPINSDLAASAIHSKFGTISKQLNPAGLFLQSVSVGTVLHNRIRVRHQIRKRRLQDRRHPSGTVPCA